MVTEVSEARRVLTSSSRTSAGVWCQGSMEVNVVGPVFCHNIDKELMIKQVVGRSD